MADREYIPFYRSFYEQISACDDPKARLEMYEVLLDYAFNKKEPDFDKGNYNSYTHFFWLGARPILRKSWAQYENGCKGGAPKGNTNNKGKRKIGCEDDHDLVLDAHGGILGLLEHLLDALALGKRLGGFLVEL